MNEFINNTKMYKTLFFTSIAIFISCFAAAQTTYYVDIARADNTGAGTSWATSKKDLQVAMNIATAGDQVWVKAGTYLPTHDPFANTAPANNRDKTFTLKNGVKIYGGFAGTETQLTQRNWQTNITTLSGDLGVVNTLTDNAYHVVIAVNVGGTILDGFTITKGYATAPWLSSVTVSGRVIDRFKGGGIFNTNSAANFTNCIIKANSADCTDTNDDAWGAGVVNDNCASAFTNCIIDGNSFLAGGGSFGVFGAGMNINGGTCTLSNCAFINNTSGSGFLDASRGGALYINASSTTITNCIFYNNSSQNGAVLGCGGADANLSSFTNCTFAGNTSPFAGTTFSGFAKATFKNCILWNNVPTSNPVAGRDEIYSQDNRVGFQPTFTNCIIRDATGSPLGVVNAVLNNCINSNPLFVNLTDADGADNIFMTADDGLRLQCTSPAIGAGTGSFPLVDILNLPRTATIDIGAYEGGHSSTAFNAIPTINTTIQLSQSTTGITNYSDCSNQLVSVQSGGTYNISGAVTAKVWIESTQPSNFVKRHYEITPQQNATTATGRVTLYFKQQEFTDFNAVNTVKLPTGPADAAGIANIQIEKRGGISNNGTGMPSTYSGAIQTINNASLTKLWNATAARWEISFDVTGFSGFFVKTQLGTLPLRLLSFSATAIGGCNKLQWLTANEINTKEFIIEKSTDGITFNTIAVKTATGSINNFYQYDDCSIYSGTQFYRLKMIDNDGRFSYSTVVKLTNKQNISVSIHPNPAKDFVTLNISNTFLLNTTMSIVDAKGAIMLQKKITNLNTNLNINGFAKGMYLLRFVDGTSVKIVKE